MKPKALAVYLLFVIAVGFVCARAEEIKGLHGRQVSPFRGELIWFVEGINQREVAYDNGAVFNVMYVTCEPVSSAIAVRFDGLNWPYYIDTLKAMISSSDTDPGSPGDQFSSFYLSVHEDSSGSPGASIAGLEPAGAEGNWINGAEWVAMHAGNLITDADRFWGRMTWDASTPCAPGLAGDGGGFSANTFYSAESIGWSWRSWQTANAMIRAVILENDLEGFSDPEDEFLLPDSFRVYYSGQPYLYPAEQFHDTTIIGACHSRVVLEGPENYFLVTAFRDGQEIDTSGIVMISGSSSEYANVDFEPNQIAIDLVSGSDTSLFLEIKNNSHLELNYRFEHIDLLQEKTISAATVTVIPSEGSIIDDLTDTIRIDINSSPGFLGDYLVNMRIVFWDSLQGYMPEDYHIALHLDQYTGIHETDEAVPDEFSLGHNYPNPFNSSTLIPFSVPEGAGEARFHVFNIAGRVVLEEKIRAGKSGFYEWDGRDAHGNDMPSGVYFYSLRAGDVFLSRKMIYLK